MGRLGSPGRPGMLGGLTSFDESRFSAAALASATETGEEGRLTAGGSGLI